jgi:hypothetical protein
MVHDTGRDSDRDGQSRRPRPIDHGLSDIGLFALFLLVVIAMVFIVVSILQPWWFP